MTMTQPADLVRGSRATATVSVGVEQGRLWVYWRAADRHIWEEIFTDFRSVFSRHKDAVARGRGRGWSLPLHHRRRLAEWLDRWFSPEQVSGSLEEPPTQAAGGMPAAGEILRLCARREELRRVVRKMPQRGPVGRQMTRELGAIERKLREIAAGQGVEG